MKCPLFMCPIVLEVYRTIENHTEPYRTIQNHIEPYTTIQNYIGLICVPVRSFAGGNNSSLERRATSSGSIERSDCQLTCDNNYNRENGARSNSGSPDDKPKGLSLF